MEELRTHYPDYDVLAHQDEWDDHTREVVNKRLGPFTYKIPRNGTGTGQSSRPEIVYDDRKEILDWVLAHIDQS